MAHKEYPEQHQEGTILFENPEVFGATLPAVLRDKDLGVQIAKDGRVWVCIDGIAFLRFTPHPNGKMKPDGQP